MPSRTEEITQSLPNSINAATRPVHTKLNKLVLSRLPLATPPIQKDATIYGYGILHVAPIYITFESLWRTVLEPLAPGGATGGLSGLRRDDVPSARQPAIRPEIRSLLANLHFEGLQRSEVLHKDLSCLMGWPIPKLTDQLRDVSTSPVHIDFLSHIRESVAKAPHTLLAYAWVMYMALFSGGRYIRKRLEAIDPAFWISDTVLPLHTVDSTAPLSFFRFDTPDDGEDLKLEFKKRLLESEGVLTETERQEIVQEAQHIFEYMIKIVDQLDHECPTQS